MNRPRRAASLAPFVLLVAACGAPPDAPVDAASDAAARDVAAGHDAVIADTSMAPDSANLEHDDAAAPVDAATPIDAPIAHDAGGARDAATPPHDAGGACVSDKLVPTCGGAWWGADPGATGLSAFETSIGRHLDITHAYHVDAEAFPTAAEAAQDAAGRILLLNWKPSSATNGWHIAASGSIDAEIAAEADRLVAFGHPLFLALYHEPENNLAGGSDTLAGTAADYVAMWHHVRAIFDAYHVTNVVWVWDMMGFAGHAAHYQSGDLYPGDSYVDWIAYDPYCHNPATEPFATTVNSGATASWPGFYTWATTAHPGVPLMLAEFGSTESSGDAAAKGRWFTDAITALRTTRAAIRAVVYFNLDPWTVESSSASLAGYTSAGHDALVNPAHH